MESLSGPDGDHPTSRRPSQGDVNQLGEGSAGEVEPCLAKLEDDGNGAGVYHPSSAVGRKTSVIMRSASDLGSDAAATFLQSRFRGYLHRKHGGPAGHIPGAVNSERRTSDDGRYSVLDLEVHCSKENMNNLETCSVRFWGRRQPHHWKPELWPC